jgi:hypothetical protein
MVLASRTDSWGVGWFDHECVASPNESSVLVRAGEFTGNFWSCPFRIAWIPSHGAWSGTCGVGQAVFNIRRFIPPRLPVLSTARRSIGLAWGAQDRP